jgi:hypothetical protein
MGKVNDIRKKKAAAKKPAKKAAVFTCPECGAKYTSPQGVSRHKKAKHPEAMRPGPGKPLIFESVADLEKAINDYFTSCEPQWVEEKVLVERKQYVDVNEGLDGRKPKMEKQLVIENGRVQYDEQIKMVKREARIPTVSGLAYALDTSRQTLLDYQATDEYFDTIKRAKQFIEAAVEALLVNGGVVPSGVIFNLKNNYGWVDKSEVSVTDKANAAKKALDRLEADAAGSQDDFADYAQKELNSGKPAAH